MDLSRSLNKFIYEKFPFDGKTQITIAEDKIVAAVASFQNSTSTELLDLTMDWLGDKKTADESRIWTVGFKKDTKLRK